MFVSGFPMNVTPRYAGSVKAEVKTGETMSASSVTEQVRPSGVTTKESHRSRYYLPYITIPVVYLAMLVLLHGMLGLSGEGSNIVATAFIIPYLMLVVLTEETLRAVDAL